MAEKGFDFNFDEIRIQDTDQAGFSSAMDNAILNDEDTSTLQKVEGQPDSTKENKKQEDKTDTVLPLEGSLEGGEDNKSIDVALEEHFDLEEEEENEEEENQNKASKISNLVKNYYELGIFTGDPESDPIETDEDLLERFQLEKKNGANEFLNQFLSKFGQDYLNAFQKIFVEGVDPRTYYTTVSAVQDIADLDMEKEENQMHVVRQYYKDILNLSDDVAEKKLKIMKDAGELVSEANVAVDKIQYKVEQDLKLKAQTKQQEEAAKQYTHQVYDNSLRTVLQSDLSGDNFKGLPVNSQVVGAIYNNLVRPAWRLASGEEITDFQKFLLDLKKPENVKTAILIDLLRQNDFDLSSIQIKKENKKKTQLFDALATKETTVKRKSPISASTPTKFI